MIKTKFYIYLLLGLLPNMAFGQATVEIFPDVQRYLDEVSDLDRSKFFKIHSTSNNAQFKAFAKEYDVKIGRGFWGPLSVAKQKTGQVGVYPSYSNSSDGAVRDVATGVVGTHHPQDALRWDTDVNKAADWCAYYYKNIADQSSRHEFFEVMNEPFVHASDDVFKTLQPDDQKMRVKMAELYAAIGKKFANTPELANMKVIGYSAAWPSMELWDFKHWDTRMKMFMDVAGEYMAGFATHLYDGINVTGQDTKRSGSNADAILDLIETYSYTKWGIVKPHAITEYGGIEKGFGDNWSEIRSIQSVRSMNHILMGLMERENRLLTSIPFIGDRAEWHITAAYNYQPYGSVLWRPKVMGVPINSSTEWVYTPRIHFYQLWKGVKGKRVQINTDNPDIQVQAFVDGQKLYVALSNIDEVQQTVSLKFPNSLAGFSTCRTKRLKIYDNRNPVYTDNESTTAPQSLTLIKDETVVLQYTFDKNIEFSRELKSKNYYTSEHLKPIDANQTITFHFNDVAVAKSGTTMLKMGISRKHDKSKQPVLTINGTEVEVPSNWVGYDQANRDDFFGVINIPFDYRLLLASNEVKLTFPDTGGRISTMILNVQNFTGSANSDAYPDGVLHTIPGVIEAEDYDMGGEGKGFHDSTPTNQSGKYRNDAVDIEATNNDGGGFNISYIDNGEWLNYSASVERPGLYNIETQVASLNQNGAFRFLVDGVEVGNLTNFNASGGWQNWIKTNTEVFLTAGKHIITFKAEAANFNLDKFSITLIGTDEVQFIQAPLTVPTSELPSVSIKYKVMNDRSLRLSLIQGSDVAISKEVNISKGDAEINIDWDAALKVAAGEDYYWVVEVKQPNDTWSMALTKAIASGVTVIDESLDLSTLPTTFKAKSTLNLTLSYAAPTKRELQLDFVKDDIVYTSYSQEVEINSKAITITVPFERLPQNGSGYSWVAYLKPVGSTVSEASTTVRLDNITVLGESISLLDLLPVYEPSTLYRINVQYDLYETRDIAIELWKGNEKIAERVETVASGNRTKILPIRPNPAPANGSDYWLKAYVKVKRSDVVIFADSTQITIDDGTAVNDIRDTDWVNMYPNPVHHQLNFSFKTSDPTSIHIYDMGGQLVYQEQRSAFQVSIPINGKLNTGVYLIVIEQGNDRVKSKLLVQ